MYSCCAGFAQPVLQSRALPGLQPLPPPRGTGAGRQGWGQEHLMLPGSPGGSIPKDDAAGAQARSAGWAGT